VKREGRTAAINGGPQVVSPVPCPLMSIFSEMLSGPGADTLLAASGERLELLPGGPVTGIVGEEREVVKYTASGRMLVRERAFSLSVDASSRFGGIDKPTEGLKVKYTDRWLRVLTYEVKEVSAAASGLVTLLGTRIGITERTREAARGGL
jgi:hypothetical protein